MVEVSDRQAGGYAMSESSRFAGSGPRGTLDDLVREGAKRMLQAALEAEVDAFLTAHAGRRDEGGRRQVVRNGRLPARQVLTGAGPVEVEQPRVRDRGPAEGRVRFTS